MTRALRAWPLILAVLGLGPGLARAAGDKPRAVAVMPFRNASGDAQLDWLSLGIAEAMTSDLRKLRGFRVVERTQVERAITELKLQKGDDPQSRAADLGKLVGARLLVVGGYQVSGGSARLTARFVDVETGVVENAAKVTGPLKQIFALEDKIVDQLTARYRVPVSKEERAEVRKVPTKNLDAFRLYALALGAGSSDEKRAFLKSAVALDPKFTFAVDDLAALEKRMEGYREKRDKAVEEKAAELDKLRRDEKLGAQAAMQLLASRMQSFQWKRLLGDAERIYKDPPRSELPGMDVREMASFYIFQAHHMLKHVDLALQAGERHLKEYPAGAYFQSVESMMNFLIEERRKREEGKAALVKALSDLDLERQQLLSQPSPNDVRVRSLDWQPCLVAVRDHHQYARALELCAAYRKKHPQDPGDSFYVLSSFYTMLALAELGRFDDARKQAAELTQRVPTAERDYHLKSMMQSWPRD